MIQNFCYANSFCPRREPCADKNCLLKEDLKISLYDIFCFPHTNIFCDPVGAEAATSTSCKNKKLTLSKGEIICKKV